MVMNTAQNEIGFTLNKISSLRGAELRSNSGIEHTRRLFTHPVFSIPSYLESTPLDRGEYSRQSGQATVPPTAAALTRTTEIKGLKW